MRQLVEEAGLLNWQAEFRDPEMESLFNRTILAYHACQLRLALVLIAGLFLAFALADYSLLGAGGAFAILLAIRLVTVAACLAAAGGGPHGITRQPGLPAVPFRDAADATAETLA